MITCTRRLTFSAGHRVMGHENKCAHPHGHNYVAHVTVEAPGLDEVGRIVDFSVIKEGVGGWIDATWDHAFLLHDQDTALLTFLTQNDFKYYCLPYNPTAENLARMLTEVANRLLRQKPGGLRVTKVEIEETENCRAAYVVPHQ